MLASPFEQTIGFSKGVRFDEYDLESLKSSPGAAPGYPLPLVGRVVSAANREGSFLPHSNIDPKTRNRAKTLRTELTKAEATMWSMLRDFRSRGARFRRETPIGPYIADFAWLAARIIVEVDSDSHETDTGGRHDARRDQFLKSQGFTVLSFDNDQVLDGPDYVFITIESHLAAFLKPEPSA
ncbi:endonuclease domain-containing protein [Pararhizobium sp.]|uniref:endonuclease domain-containing protein n=1 Tax=Pararhizobium sp. TaxID=1977563 RepID=UPI00271EF46A|nr:DUF559 domain-containing protein [Pararhizobium sp.]MDO9414999.1 DUF559 domain-containing protein [Pararhizobium sp.]